MDYLSGGWGGESWGETSWGSLVETSEVPAPLTNQPTVPLLGPGKSRNQQTTLLKKRRRAMTLLALALLEADE